MSTKIKRFVSSIVAVACLLGVSSLSASASSKTEYDETDDGYYVFSKIEQESSYATGTGRVVSGPPCNIHLHIYTFKKLYGSVVLAGELEDDVYGQYITRNTGGSSLIGATARTGFNGYEVWAHTGTISVYYF